jgi:peptidoglycan/LPS O-acetylase OafA/YrhL
MSLDSWAYALPGTFYLFAEGMALAVLSVLWQQHPGFWPSLKRVAPWGWALAAAAYVALAIKVPAATLGSVHPAWGLVALLVLLPATMTDIGGVPAVVMGFGVLRWLGLVSYAIYLWHQKVLEVTQRYVQSPWLTLLVVLIATTAIAAASYHFIERPFLRLKRRLATAAG